MQPPFVFNANLPMLRLRIREGELNKWCHHDPTRLKTDNPREEFRQRWQRVQDMMAQQRLDLLIAYADDRAVFGPGPRQVAG